MSDSSGVAFPKLAFSAVAGSVYSVLGALQLIAGLGLRGRWSELLLLGGSPMEGFVIALVGVVFLQGAREMRSGIREGAAFMYMGILLALFLLLLELAEAGASYLGEALIGGDYAGYSLTEGASPALYLAPFPIAGWWHWRSAFTLVPRGGPSSVVKGLNNSKEA
jgi:hypothetical protein